MPECNLIARQADYDSAVVKKPLILAAAASPPSSGMAVVPVKFHVLLDDDGTSPFGAESLTEDDIEQALTILEQNFSNSTHTYDFVRCGKINFVPSTAVRTGVVFPSNLVFFPHMANVYVGSHFGPSADLPEIGLNIFLPHPIDITNTTFTHEFGHHFGLFHTDAHQLSTYVVPSHPDPAISLPPNQVDHPYAPLNPGRRRELVIRDSLPPFSQYLFKVPNCAFAGDLICDTPAGCRSNSPNEFPNCSFDPQNCQYTGTYRDYNGMLLQNMDIFIKNFMSKSGLGDCRTEFRDQQYIVVNGYYDTLRSLQYRPLNCGNLEDRVEFKGTSKGLDRVSVRIDNYISLTELLTTKTITDSNGDFDGILNWSNINVGVTSEVNKLGSNSDLSYSHGDWYDGVTTYDLVLMTKHVLGLKYLDGYDQVAADVNNDGMVTTSDIVEVRKLILFINSTFPAFNQPWRYIPEYIPIDNPGDFDGVGIDNPFQYELTGAFIYYMNGRNGKAGFDGVKLGDVNGSNSENIGDDPPSEGDPVYVDIEKTVVGGEVHFGFKVEDFDDIEGYQMELQFDPQKLSFDHSEQEDLSGVNPDLFGTTNTSQGLIYTLWYDAENAQPATLEDFKKIFTLVFDEINGYTDGDITLVENIGLRSDSEYKLPKNYAIGKDGEIRRMVMRHLGSGHLASIQSIPNPFDNSLTLLVEAVEDGDATIGIFNSFGQQLFYTDKRLEKGRNSLSVKGIENWPDGIYFVTVKVAGQVYTEKIIKKN